MLLGVHETDDGSVIWYDEGDFGIKYLDKNKSQNFWHGMSGKEVFLRGQLLHVDAKEELIVFTAVCCKTHKV